MLDKPIKFIIIEFDAVATILMSYLFIGEPEFGTKVVPIFKTTDPSYTILDLSWVTQGTPAKELPAVIAGGENFPLSALPCEPNAQPC